MARNIEFSVYHGDAGQNGLRKTLTVNGRKYVATGGGYDMVGTVWAYWLTENYSAELIELAKRVESDPDNWHYGDRYAYTLGGPFYGLYLTRDENNEIVSARVEGGCGMSCVQRISEAIGIIIRENWERTQRSANRTFYDVTFTN